MRQESSRKLTSNYEDKIIKEIESLPDVKIGWTVSMDEILKQYYGKKQTIGLAKVLGKSESAVRNRAKKLYLTR